MCILSVVPYNLFLLHATTEKLTSIVYTKTSLYSCCVDHYIFTYLVISAIAKTTSCWIVSYLRRELATRADGWKPCLHVPLLHSYTIAEEYYHCHLHCPSMDKGAHGQPPRYRHVELLVNWLELRGITTYIVQPFPP